MGKEDGAGWLTAAPVWPETQGSDHCPALGTAEALQVLPVLPGCCSRELYTRKDCPGKMKLCSNTQLQTQITTSKGKPKTTR